MYRTFIYNILTETVSIQWIHGSIFTYFEIKILYEYFPYCNFFSYEQVILFNTAKKDEANICKEYVSLLSTGLSKTNLKL